VAYPSLSRASPRLSDREDESFGTSPPDSLIVVIGSPQRTDRGVRVRSHNRGMAIMTCPTRQGRVAVTALTWPHRDVLPAPTRVDTASRGRLLCRHEGKEP
jgi:hypothetical protein